MWQRNGGQHQLHVVICVHGLDGNSADLRLIKTYLEILVLIYFNWKLEMKLSNEHLIKRKYFVIAYMPTKAGRTAILQLSFFARLQKISTNKTIKYG